MKHLLLAVLFAACGSDKKSEPAAGSAVAPAPAAGSAMAQLNAEPTADNEACKILTKADAEAWIGTSLEKNTGKSMPVGWDCKWKSMSPFSSVTLLLYTKDGAGALEQQKAAKMFGPSPVEIAGVGTSAVRSAENNIIGVVQNGRLAWLLLAGGPRGQKPTAEQAEKLARAVAARM